MQARSAQRLVGPGICSRALKRAIEISQADDRSIVARFQRAVRRVATYEFSPAFQGWVRSTINRFRRVATAECFAGFSIVATRRTTISCALVQAINDLPKINRRSATKSLALPTQMSKLQTQAVSLRRKLTVCVTRNPN